MYKTIYKLVLFSFIRIIIGWLRWGAASGAGSPWTHEYTNNLHLPVLHTGHGHVWRCECQVSWRIILYIYIQILTVLIVLSCRWVPTLNPNDVADRVISAIKKNEKLAVIPGFLKFLLSFKWYVRSCGNALNENTDFEKGSKSVDRFSLIVS